MDDDGRGEVQDIEFEAHGADIALSLTARYCGTRSVAMFEDDRLIAEVRQVAGVWHVADSKDETRPPKADRISAIVGPK